MNMNKNGHLTMVQGPWSTKAPLWGACAIAGRLWGIVCDNQKKLCIYIYILVCSCAYTCTITREFDVKVDAIVKLIWSNFYHKFDHKCALGVQGELSYPKQPQSPSEAAQSNPKSPSPAPPEHCMKEGFVHAE